jgi:hypothetical protein
MMRLLLRLLGTCFVQTQRQLLRKCFYLLMHYAALVLLQVCLCVHLLLRRLGPVTAWVPAAVAPAASCAAGQCT